MIMTATRLLQPARCRLEAFLRQMPALILATSVVAAQIAPAFAAPDAPPQSAPAVDLAKLATTEIIAGITIGDLGAELAEQALDMIGKGVPPIAIIRNLIKRVDARKEREADIARLDAMKGLMGKLAVALAEHSEVQQAHFEKLVADNKRTHDELEKARREIAQLRGFMYAFSRRHKDIASALQQMQRRSAPPRPVEQSPQPPVIRAEAATVPVWYPSGFGR